MAAGYHQGKMVTYVQLPALRELEATVEGVVVDHVGIVAALHEKAEVLGASTRRQLPQVARQLTIAKSTSIIQSPITLRHSSPNMFQHAQTCSNLLARADVGRVSLNEIVVELLHLFKPELFADCRLHLHCTHTPP